MGSFVYFEDYDDHIKEAKKSQILDELEKFIDLALEIYNNVDIQTLNMIKNKIKDLKEEKNLGSDKE